MIKTGFSQFLSRRIVSTTINALKGLRDGFRYEEAFRVELSIALVLLPSAFFVAVNYLQLIALVATVLLVLIVELLNTGIEMAVDRIGLEFHELSGRAKDVSSAAVFIALILCVIVWGTVLIENLHGGFGDKLR